MKLYRSLHKCFAVGVRDLRTIEQDEIQGEMGNYKNLNRNGELSSCGVWGSAEAPQIPHKKDAHPKPQGCNWVQASSDRSPSQISGCPTGKARLGRDGN